LAACAAGPPARNEPPAPAAAAAFTRARHLLAEEGVEPEDPRVWRELRVAELEDPDWVAPRRLADDLLRSALRGVEALERRRQELALDPGDPRALYLVARLEGADDPEVYRELLGDDPAFAWGWHALAVTRARAGEGDVGGAWRRAIELGRVPWESAHFGRSLARQLALGGETEEAVALLARLLDRLPLSSRDAAALRAEMARTELEARDEGVRRRGYARGLELLRDAPLEAAELATLVAQLEVSACRDDPAGSRLELALGAREAAVRARLEARRWLDSGRLDYARALLAPWSEGGEGAEAVAGEPLETPLRLFAQQRFAEAVERWRIELPPQVLAEDGLPREPGLRELVAVARRMRGAFDPSLFAELGEALLAVGWYEEAQAVAGALRPLDPFAARDLRRRALAGRVLAFDLQRGLGDLQRGEPSLEVALAGEREGDTGSLDDLLRRWGRAFEDCARAQGVAPVGLDSAERLAASPRLSYGPFAELVHPGPRYSAADERAGLGREGEPVPGLARELDAHHRFGIVGSALGQGPDATVLRRLLVEERSGEHLGVPWHGTIAWCEGADVLSAVQRNGAEVGGAAVHEGYWIDLEQLRGPYRRWTSLARRFGGEGQGRGAPAEPGALRRVEAILATRGLALRTPPSQPRGRARERRSIRFPLGEVDRLRLAILRERAAPGELFGEVEFGEYVDLTAKHEEGHLCDRTRFLPLSKNVGAWLELLLDNGFSPTRVRETLEYRAQLVSLCVVDEPRLALVPLLGAAEGGADAGLGHAPAYRRLLVDLVAELDRRLAEDSARYPRLTLERTLVHQLHHLGGEELRELGLAVARRAGLVEASRGSS